MFGCLLSMQERPFAACFRRYTGCERHVFTCMLVLTVEAGAAGSLLAVFGPALADAKGGIAALLQGDAWRRDVGPGLDLVGIAVGHSSTQQGTSGTGNHTSEHPPGSTASVKLRWCDMDGLNGSRWHPGCSWRCLQAAIIKQCASLQHRNMNLAGFCNISCRVLPELHCQVASKLGNILASALAVALAVLDRYSHRAGLLTVRQAVVGALTFLQQSHHPP